ncbi:MAG TPA: winged helix-turn-helix domain-containing protein [Vicinamibacteria bacterium]|nr:winged helix-turn-helix domain-containing protein [Vicinamibacteria bacterium]
MTPPMGTPADVLRFGPFRLDPAKRVLWRGDEVVPLAPRALDLLVALAEQQGDVVPKQTLMDRVWPGTFVEEANLSVNVSALRKALGTQANGRPYIETLARRGYRLAAPVRAATAARPPSIAVLPFKRLSSVAEDEYLAVGLADALIARLSRLGRLAVRPTSAVLKYGSPGTDPQEAGRALQVDAVVDGTLQREGTRLRIGVQLVPVRGDGPTWSQTFEEEMTGLFAVQDAMAEQVARALALELREPERRLLAHRHTQDLGAQEAYLKGRYFWSRFTGPWLEKAFASFQEAAERDPAYALPHAGLADACLILGFTGMLPPSAAWERADTEVRQALERDEGLAEAHVSRAYVSLFQDWDWATARRELDRAAELGPHTAAVRQWRGVYLAMLGRFDEAGREIAHARQLDPLSVVASTIAGLQAYLSGDREAAFSHHRASVDLDPHHFLGHWGLGLALQSQGRPKDALAEHREAVRLAPDATLLQPVLARSLALAGHKAEARQALDEATKAAPHLSAYQQATVHVALGRSARALDLLERAGEERDPWLVWLKVDPMLEPLRAHPRMRRLLARVLRRAGDAGTRG